MAIKLKQYLENSWYRGASQDRQTGYAAQFQYGEGINVRDMKNGVCLAGGRTEVKEMEYAFSYFTYKGDLYIVDTEGDIYDDEGTLLCSTGVYHVGTPVGIEFGGDMWIVGDGGIVQVTPAIPNYVVNNRTPTGFAGYGSCALNYANTFLLVGDGPLLWRYDFATGTPIAKKIREFETSYNILGLTQEGNYIKIYVSNKISTKIHYAKGTFDVEDTGLVQTVSFVGLAVNIGHVVSDQGNDYAVFKVASGEYKLAKVQGYNKTDIRWTQSWDGKKIFTSKTSPSVTACDGVLFISMDEGIWTFTEYNGWLWGGCVEFPKGDAYRISGLFRYGEKLYCCRSEGGSYYIDYYDMSFHPATYQPSGFIIGRVFDGGCAGLFKKNDQATITYNMPVGTSMELSYRYDRSSFGYDKSNFLSVKNLTDTNSCYDIVVPTTPSTSEQGLLLLEDDNNLLLENGDDIKLEDLIVCPFNKTWNLLEYRIDFSTTNNTKTPILFEHSLTYYDYMRKYR